MVIIVKTINRTVIIITWDLMRTFSFSLVAGFIAGMLNGWNLDKCVTIGLTAAGCSLEQSPAVPKSLSNLLV